MTNEEKVLIKSILDMNLSTYDTAISVAEAIKKTTEQQILEKACEWLKENANLYIYLYCDEGDFKEVKLDIDDLTETFKQAMEE